MLAATAIVLFALLLRLLYVGMSQVEYPIRGDSNQYVLYAWNLTHRATFSTSMPDEPEAVPDSYRGPGYPLLLAATMVAAGHADLPLRPGPGGLTALGRESDTWMTLAQLLQALLGAATVALVIATMRLWAAPGWALAAGAITALWPHLVSFSGVLLSETLFGFVLMLALWLLCRCVERPDARSAAAAGIGWGCACLVNPVAGLFPLLAGAVMVRSSRRAALIFVLGFAVLPAAWAIRNSAVAQGPGALERIEQNFVQGSWPQYHTAFNSRFDNAISRRIVAAIDGEFQTLHASPGTGLAAIADRFAVDPPYYLRWYLLSKPFLLWDWDVRIGAGDIYYLPTTHSPFARIPLLAMLKTALRWLNPVFFLLAAAAAFAGAWATLFRARASRPFGLLCLLALYLTAVHVALQAEPRYSVPYRPEEIMLAVAALAWITFALARRLRPRVHGADDARPDGVAEPPAIGIEGIRLP
jgi:hypothetical protein